MESGKAYANETYGMVRLLVDTLDQIAFPHRGVLGMGEYRNTIEGWDSDFDYDSFEGDLRIYQPLGERHTIGLSGRIGLNVNGEAELPRAFVLGGFGTMSAYDANSLFGNSMLLGQIRYEWKGGIWGRMPWYMGLAGEMGGVGDRLTDTTEDMKFSSSPYVALDTVFGPLMVAYSFGSDDHRTAWLLLGTPF
jgi:outer membrane translocation and assembly module TamA